MRRHPPSTIYRYLELPSTQKIQTHNTHRHNITSPSKTLAQAAHPLSPNTTHTTETKTPLSPCYSRILVMPKPNLVTDSPPPRAKHTPVTHSIYTSNHTYLQHVTCTSQTPERVLPIYALTATTPPTEPTSALTSPSQQTHMQHKQLYIHHSHRNNRTNNIRCHDNLTERPRTTTGRQTPHRPISKSERNLIILQVNINGLKLLIHDTHANIVTIQQTKLTPKVKTPKVHNFTAMRNDMLHKAWRGLITLITFNTTHTFDH